MDVVDVVVAEDEPQRQDGARFKDSAFDEISAVDERFRAGVLQHFNGELRPLFLIVRVGDDAEDHGYLLLLPAIDGTSVETSSNRLGNVLSGETKPKTIRNSQTPTPMTA